MQTVHTNVTSDFMSGISDFLGWYATRGQRITAADGTVSGWKAVAVNDDSATQPPTLTAAEAGLTKVFIGGSGNTVWQWGVNGMFEKTTVTPERDAPQRTFTVLRPWGSTTSPVQATEANSHATVQTITPLFTGDSVSKVEKINGYEYSWEVSSKAAWKSGGDLFPSVHETRQRFPDGWNSVPSVDYTRRRLRESGNIFSGRPIYHQSNDGTVTSYTNEELPESFEDPVEPAVLTTQVQTSPDGIVRKIEEIESGYGETLSRKNFIVFNQADHLESETRHTYNYFTGALDKSEWRDIGGNSWHTSHERIYVGEQLAQVVSTDKAGVVTIESDFDAEERPLTTTRAPYSVAGTPQVAARITRRQFNSIGQMILETIAQPNVIGSGESVQQKKEWTYYTDGRLKSETLNNEVTTAYGYENAAVGGEVLKVFRQVGQDEQTKALVSESTTDWSGRNSTVTGPGVVTEDRAFDAISAVSGRHSRETTTRGSGNAVVVTKKEFDGLGRVLGETLPGSSVVNRILSYDNFGRPKSLSEAGTWLRQWDYNGATTTLTVNASPDPIRVSNSVHEIVQINGVLWEIARDQKRESRRQMTALPQNVLSVTTSGLTDYPDRFYTTTCTREAGGIVKETSFRPGVSDPSTAYSFDGHIFSIKAHSADPGSSRRYDAMGRLVNIADFSGRRVTQIQYDALYGQVSQVTTTDQQTGLSSCKITAFYPAGSAERGRVETDTANGLVTYSAWTGHGQLLAQWGATYPVKYEYDALGRLWKMQTFRVDPTVANPVISNPSTWTGADTTEWVYKPGTYLLQQKKDAVGLGATYTYDARGRISVRAWARTIAGQSLMTTYNYNEANDLRGINYSDATPDVTIARNAKGEVVSISDGVGSHVYTRNADGTIASEVLPGIGSGNAYMEYGYDSFGRRRGYFVAEGNDWVTWQGWNIDGDTGRYNGINTPDGWIPFRYDNEKGLFTGWSVLDKSDTIAVEPTISVTRSYDGLGRITSVQSTNNVNIPGTSRSYGYDGHSRRSSLLDESGEYWTYTYNDRSEVIGGIKKYLGSNGSPQMVPGQSWSYSYDAIGNRVSLTPGDNATPRDWTPNQLNQISSRVVEKELFVNGSANPAATVNVHANPPSYTEANGTVTVIRGQVPKSDLFSAKISTDQPSVAQNLKVTVSETSGSSGTTSYEGHRVLPASPEVFAYDADGNLTQDGRWKYTWDAENRLIRMDTRNDVAFIGPDALPKLRLTFGYDASGRRTAKKVEELSGDGVYVQQSDSRFVYDGWNLIAEWHSTPTNVGQIKTYHWGPDLSGSLTRAGGVGGLILCRSIQGSFAVEYDGNGNVTGLRSCETGELKGENSYGPFGELLRGSASALSSFQYSTKYADAETGLVYYGYRYYSVNMGKWISRDPLGEMWSKNLMGMLDNNPANGIDVLGLYNLQYDVADGFSKEDKAMIDAAFQKTRDAAVRAKAELDKIITAMVNASYTTGSYGDVKCGPCLSQLLKELQGLQSVLGRMIEGLDSGKNLEIEEKSMGSDYARLWRSALPNVMDPIIQLNTDPDRQWREAGPEGLAADIFHEISHLYGTTDEFEDGCHFNNAHIIENLVMNQNFSTFGIYQQRLSRCRKNPNKPVDCKNFLKPPDSW